MRTDLFQDRKCVHVKLEKSTHAAFRTQLFNHNLSMQEVFDEFARLIVRGDSRAQKIIENLIVRKVEAQIDGKLGHLKQKQKQKQKKKPVNENDRDLLYSIIEGTKDERGSGSDGSVG